MAEVKFEVMGQGELGAELQGWGPWSSASRSTLDSRARGDSTAPLLWRVELPASPRVALSALECEATSSRRLEVHSASALPRLNALLATQRQAQDGALSFAVQDGALASSGMASQPLAVPERELWAALNDAQVAPSLSFGMGAADSDEATQRGVVELLSAPLLQLSRYAQIETRLGGRCIGCTRVGLTGDFTSVLAAERTAQEQALHQRSVALALQSRRAWIGSLLLTLQCALTLARAATNPLSAARLLWMAGKYVRSVVAEARPAA
jgi:hypothetical protein